jgi:hypothetical protein
MNLFKNLKMNRLDFVLISILVILLLCSGCRTWEWKHPQDYKLRKVDEQHDGGWSATLNYYVIDANADVPDAYFETKNEALAYQKDFAEHHDYVIVKIDKKYNVYNMAKPISLTP